MAFGFLVKNNDSAAIIDGTYANLYLRSKFSFTVSSSNTIPFYGGRGRNVTSPVTINSGDIWCWSTGNSSAPTLCWYLPPTNQLRLRAFTTGTTVLTFYVFSPSSQASPIPAYGLLVNNANEKPVFDSGRNDYLRVLDYAVNPTLLGATYNKTFSGKQVAIAMPSFRYEDYADPGGGAGGGWWDISMDHARLLNGNVLVQSRNVYSGDNAGQDHLYFSEFGSMMVVDVTGL